MANSVISALMPILILPIRILRHVFDLFTDHIFALFYEGPSFQRKIPPIKDLVLLDSATILAEKIRTRKLSSVQVVEAYIQRIKDVNPIVNCIVDTRSVVMRVNRLTLLTRILWLKV